MASNSVTKSNYEWMKSHQRSYIHIVEIDSAEFAEITVEMSKQYLLYSKIYL